MARFSFYTNGTYTLRISHNTQGGSAVSQTSNSVSSNSSSVSVTAHISETVPTKTGYNFTGWNGSSDGTGTDYSPGDSVHHTFSRSASLDRSEVQPNGDIYDYYETSNQSSTKTVYAQWSLITYTVSYNANGGTGAPAAQTKSYGVDLTLSSTSPTRTGYNFMGWGTSETATTATYQPGGTYAANANATLYAVWQIISYTVSYKKGSNGTGTNTSDTKNYGATLTLKGAIFTRTGYTQTGWSTTDGGAKAYNLSGSYTANANATLYPFWTIDTYTVSYNANGGSGAPSAQTKTYNVALTLSSTAPTRTGYSFLGWSTSSTATSATYCTGPSHTTNNSYTTNARVTLYAVWSILTYTVSYNKGSNGTGTNSTATKTYNVDLTLKGAQFTRTGFSQTGWATSDGGAQAYALNDTYQDNAPVTLYPVWTAGKSTVSASDGTLGTQQTISITRYDVSYTHDLTYQYGNQSGTIATGVGTSYNWTPDASLAVAFPKASSGTCVITCTTKNGTATVGTSTVSIALTIPSSAKRVVNSVTLTENVAGLASQFGAFVQGKSKISVTASLNSASGSPSYGATLTAYNVSINGETFTAYPMVTGYLKNSGTNSYSFKITDTRGYSDDYSGTYSVLAYSAPNCTAQIQRNTSDDTQIDVAYGWTISSCNSHNTKTYKIEYKLSSVNTWTTATSGTLSAYTGTGSYSINGLDGNSVYDVRVTISDYFDSSARSQTIAAVGDRVLHFSKTDKTMSRHGANTSDGWDHQYFNERFHKTIDVVGRRCRSAISSAGWYRVLTYNAPSAAVAQGYYSMLITLTVGDLINDVHKVTMVCTNYTFDFVDETGQSSSATPYFDQVRYTYNGAVGYMDVHYTGTTSRTVWADFQVEFPADYTGRVMSNDFVASSDAPDGETIAATYTFQANTEPIDISSEFSFNTTGISVTSSQVVAWYEPKTRRVSIDYALRASAVFAVSTAFLTCNNSDYYIKTQTDFPAMIYNNNSGVWEPYIVRATTSGTFMQRLSANATKVYGHIEYYV